MTASVAYIVAQGDKTILRVLKSRGRATRDFPIDALGLARLASECGERLHTLMQRESKTGAWSTRRNLKTKGR